MILKGYLFPVIICCFGDCYRTMSGGDLIFVTFLFAVIISFLLFYYDRIPKSNLNENEIQVERKVSRLPKLILYLSIVIPSIILLVEFFNFGNLFTGFDIIMLSSLATLVLYSNITPEMKKIIKRPNLDNPIYQTKDIILQSNAADANFVIAERTTSTWAKVLVIVLILCIAFTPFQEFLGL